jgi:Mg-chelatase subunit ChlD
MPEPQHFGNVREDALEALRKYDTVVVVDDSGSMSFGQRWKEVRRQ